MTGSRFLSAVITSLVAISAVIAQATPIVVYGNLGPSGTNALHPTAGNEVSPNLPYSVAQGFIASSDSTAKLSITAVSLGLRSTSPLSMQVGIYSDVGGNPGTALISSEFVTVNSRQLYNFSFIGSGPLTGGSSYWVVPQVPPGETVFWAWTQSSAPPGAQNSSGYSSLGTKGNDGDGWIGDSSRYSMSVQAVPEPSTGVMALAGLACGGFSMWRRSQRA